MANFKSSTKQKYYMADFETVTTAPTRIWAWGVCEIGKPHQLTYDTTMDTFFQWIKGEHKQDVNKVIFFHNLAFDGEFLLHYLFSNKYHYDDDKNDNTFNTIISDDGSFYQIEVIFKRYAKRFHKVVFRDSLKKIPFSVEVIAKKFGFQTKKGSIDYHADRPIGHKLTPEEIDYLHNDIKIVALALHDQFKQGLIQMTTSGDALKSFKNTLAKNEFKFTYPVFSVEVDDDIRQGYRGGFTYLNPIYKNKDLSEGIVFDINSSYPAVMYNEKLPYGDGIYFTGEYEEDDIYDVYVQKIICEFTLKPGHLPTIQLKNNTRFSDTDYLTESGVEPVGLWLSNIDLKLFFEHYDVTPHEWVGGWKFKSCQGVFNEYIDYWSHIKSTSTGSTREFAKLMLNALYGKFASRCRVRAKVPEGLVNGVVKYGITDEKIKKPIYTPLSLFITSYGRDKVIRTAQANFDRFIYADTDSLHLIGTEPPIIDIHPTRLGAWKEEYVFTKARYLKAKLYQYFVEGEHKIKGAGMTDELKSSIKWNDLTYGFSGTKKQRKTVAGGTIIIETDFTIYE